MAPIIPILIIYAINANANRIGCVKLWWGILASVI
jgi:hypothetical protein